jgi:hypothetical protein
VVRSSKAPSVAFSPDVDAFIASYVSDIADGAAAVFAGAGLSVGSGYVNWSELMRDIASELGLDVDRESNLVAVAQYHLNARGNRTRINQKLIDEFSVGHSVNENHQTLARLPIGTYWTTNYDKMLETALEQEGKVVDIKYAVAHLKNTTRRRDVILYKMHGDVSDPENAVLTKDDYEGYFREREPFITALAGDLVSKTMLFIGFSFTDPNIDYVMSRVRVVLAKKPKQHYCILRRESRRPRERKEAFEYRSRQQDYFVKDLARIGVHALLIDDYREVTLILRAIATRYRERSVFISGSAHEFGRWPPDRAGDLIEKISASLVQSGRNVLTGFGLGVGPSVIAGAMKTILANPKRWSQNQLQAFPFPVEDQTGTGRSALYKRHRENIMSRCGIAVFLFGNKRDGRGKIVPAAGMREEYEIAKAAGLKVIAIGSTGWVAEEIGKEQASLSTAHTRRVKAALRTLNEFKAPNDAIAAAVLVVAKELTR